MHDNLKYLLLIRIIAMTGQLLALIFMRRFFGIDLPIIPIIIVFLSLSVFTFLSWLHLQKCPTDLRENIFITTDCRSCCPDISGPLHRWLGKSFHLSFYPDDHFSRGKYARRYHSFPNTDRDCLLYLSDVFQYGHRSQSKI